jgi:hypothetical protein
MKMATVLLPEGVSIIAQDKRSAVLGRHPTIAPVLKGRCESAQNAVFSAINHLLPRSEEVFSMERM